MEGLVLAGIAAVLIFIVVAVIGALRSARRHHAPPERRSGVVQHGRVTHPPTAEARVPGPPPTSPRGRGGVNRPPGIWPGTPEAERADRLAKVLEEVWLTGTPVVPTERGSRIDWNAYARAVVARGGLR